MSFQKAVKTQAKLRLALCGLAGAGKTYSALKIGSEIGKLMRASGHGEGRIAVVDTERGSASLYADKFDFDVCELTSFSPLSYVEKIHEAEDAGYDIIILDSLSHAWAGKDGALEQKDRAAETKGNSYTAWGVVTPKQNSMIDAITGSSAHVITTIRQKMEFVNDKNERTGKTEIRKVGLGLVQRDQIDYEFTLVGEIDLEHAMKIAKTRVDGVIDIGDLFEKPGEHFARKIYGWLMSGAKPTERRRPEPVSEPAQQPDPVAAALDEAFANYLAGMDAAMTLEELDKAATGPGAPQKGDPLRDWAGKKYRERKEWIQKQPAPARSPASEPQLDGAA